jgi:hypothetical protein
MMGIVDVSEFKMALQEKLESLQAERVAVRTKLEDIDRRLEALHIVLEGEESNSTLSAERIEVKVNVTTEVREILRKAATEGLYPREIRVALQKQGIGSNAQVVANALYRLKKRDYTLEINGRHFLKVFEPYIREIQIANPA